MIYRVADSCAATSDVGTTTTTTTEPPPGNLSFQEFPQLIFYVLKHIYPFQLVVPPVRRGKSLSLRLTHKWQAVLTPPLR